MYHWSQSEHDLMQEGMRIFEALKGRHCYWNKIADHVGTKTSSQCKSHNQNFPHSKLESGGNKKRPRNMAQIDSINNSGPWTQEEHILLREAMLRHAEFVGKHKFWKRVAEDVGTRSAEQCKSHNQKRPALQIRDQIQNEHSFLSSQNSHFLIPDEEGEEEFHLHP